MPNMPEYRPGLAAAQAHIALTTSVRIMAQAHHCAVLWFGEIMNRVLCRDLGYSIMRAYAPEELGFSKTRAGDFSLLARKLKELPAVKGEMAAGRLGYTVAREIVSVADATTEKEWLQKARENPRRELIATVNQAKAIARQKQKENPDQGELVPRPVPTIPPAAVSIRVGFELSPLQFAQYEALLAKLDHCGGKAQLLLDSLEALISDTETTPRGVVSVSVLPDPHSPVPTKRL